MSSEDESWLKQARFKFSDGSDSDEAETAVNQAYLQAVAALKQAGQAGNSKDTHSAPAEKFALHSQAISNSQLAVAWPNNQLEASQPSGITKRQHQQHCHHGAPSKKPPQLPAMSPGHVPSAQSELTCTTHPEAAAPVASVSASQDAAEHYSIHNGHSSPLSTMEVLALLFPKEQSPAAAAALLPTAVTFQHSSAAVTQAPATAAAPPAKTAAPTAAPIPSAPTVKTVDDSAAADHLTLAATSALAPSPNAEPATTAAVADAAAAAQPQRGPATAAATDTGGAVADPVPLSTAASLFATTDPAARSATAAEGADGANDPTADANTGEEFLTNLKPGQLSAHKSTSGSPKATASLPPGRNMLSMLAQQMAQAIADAAIQVVQARQQQVLHIMDGFADAGSQAAGAADHVSSSIHRAQRRVRIPSHAGMASPSGSCPEQAVFMATNTPEANVLTPQPASAAATAAAAASGSAAAAASAAAMIVPATAAVPSLLATAMPSLPAAATTPVLVASARTGTQAVSMATDTPEASTPASLPLATRAPTAVADAAAAASLLSDSAVLPSTPAMTSPVISSSATTAHAGAQVAAGIASLPARGAAPQAIPKLDKQVQPPMLTGPPPAVYMGPLPPVRLGPPPPAAPLPLPSPPWGWPQLRPAWPQPQWLPSPPVPVTHWARPVVAPPAPPPGGPPPSTLPPPAALPPKPLAASKKAKQAKVGNAQEQQRQQQHQQQQRPQQRHQQQQRRQQQRQQQKQPARAAEDAHSVVRIAQPAKQSNRGLKRTNSVGSVDSNSDSEDEQARSDARQPAVQSASASTAKEGQSKARPTYKKLGKHTRRKLRQKAKLAECAQEAFAKAALKAQQGSAKAPQPQPGVKRDIGRKKTKAQYKAEHIQRLRQGTRHVDNTYL